MRALELLAPAKNLECGIAAIDHGADAVYMGSSRFGARAAAGNSIEDIAALCRYAHRYRAKVYVTVNTIVFDDELEDMRRLLEQFSEIGVDALLVQDMGLLSLPESSSIPLHASTQTDNRSVEKVKWLRSLGFRRVVLARELSVEEVAAIHEAVPEVELEVFVHGALCVSYSGVCYASQYCFGRSANRGACAQFCRMAFDLKDSHGTTIEQHRHLLSLKDLCQIDHLEELAEAGAASFKIEGRLKDVAYVKNVVSAYSQRLNELVEKSGGRYVRASLGKVDYNFKPLLEKSFNRGFTTYFLHGRQRGIFSPDTPKAVGEYVGKVKEVRGKSLCVSGTASFANGDGLCFVNIDRELEGFRVNRVDGNRLFPQRMPQHLPVGTPLFRNNDVAFEKLLMGKTAVRSIPLSLQYSASDHGIRLVGRLMEDKDGHVEASLDIDLKPANKPQRDNIIRQLTKLGNTPYVCGSMDIEEGADLFFVPSSMLTELRRQLAEQMDVFIIASEEKKAFACEEKKQQVEVTQTVSSLVWHSVYQRYSYLYNISNTLSRQFYHLQGLQHREDAFELHLPKGVQKTSVSKSLLLMQCRHCLRFALGYCVKHGGKKPTWKEPLYLELPDKRKFRLEFDCRECQMNVYNQ